MAYRPVASRGWLTVYDILSLKIFPSFSRGVECDHTMILVGLLIKSYRYLR